MWARVKLNRQKITISRAPEAVPQMCSSQKVFTFFAEHFWETASGVSLRDCSWKNGEMAEK